MNGLLEWALEHAAEWIAAGVFLVPAFGPVQAPPEIAETPVQFSLAVEAVDADQLYTVALEISGDEEWAREAVAIAWCETRLRPHLYGDSGRAFGLFQVHARYHGAVPKTVRGQVAQAYAIWSADDGRWRLWSCA